MQARRKRASHLLVEAGVAFGLFFATSGSVEAGYTFNTLTSFNGTDGQYPNSMLTLSGNLLYGTTQGGTASGATIFSLPVLGGTPTTLANVGANSALIFSGNNLYSTTAGGGASGDGTLFSIPAAGGTPTTLASFNSATGTSPSYISLVGGTFFGEAGGGSSNYGTLFSVPLTGGTPTNLATFNFSNGANPVGGLVASGSLLYGATEGYNASGFGTVFSISSTGGPITILATFNHSEGPTSSPGAGLLLSGNNLYGTTSPGANGGNGTVFSLPVNGGPLTTLASFTGENTNVPISELTLQANLLYGTTPYGGPNGDGMVFSVPVTGGSPSVAVAFNGSNGSLPAFGASLLQSGNTLYGVTEFGGRYGDGTIFSLKPNPVVSLTASAPTAFGSKIGLVNLIGTPVATFAATATGFLGVSGFSSANQTEVYALDLSDSVPSNLAVDLADAASEINAGSYGALAVFATATDPTGGLGSGYNFFISFANPTLGTASPYFGFDFTQLNGTLDTLSASAADATTTAVPEPAIVTLAVIGSVGLLRRREAWLS